MSAVQQKPQRFDQLTFFRFIAAAIVVNFHFGASATGLTGFWMAGPHMVTFFFVLSGFVITHSHINQEISFLSFYRTRLARIYPVYLLALLLAIPIQITPRETSAIALNISLLQSWISPYPLTVNPPGWSLSVEAFFYALFPFLAFFTKKLKLSAVKIAGFTLLVWGITQVFTIRCFSTSCYQGFPSLSHDLIFYFPPTHLCSFLIGCAGAVGWPALSRTGKKLLASRWVLILGFAITFAVIHYETHISHIIGRHLPFAASLLAPLFLVNILAMCADESSMAKILSRRPFVLLGESSYAMYILQLPIFIFSSKVLSTYFPTRDIVGYLIFLLVLIGVAIGVHLSVERPLNRWLRSKTPGRLQFVQA